MEGDKRLKLFRLDKNHGMPYAARNYATKEAKGELIAFLDSDDLWAENKLALQVDFMITNCYPISFTAYAKIYENNPLKKKKINIPAVVSFKDLLKTNSLGCLTTMYNVNKVGKLFQVNHAHEDYIMWLQILKKGFNAHGLKEILACYRVNEKGYSTNKLKMAHVTWNIYRKIMNINLFKSAWYFLNYAWNGYKKK